MAISFEEGKKLENEKKKFANQIKQGNKKLERAKSANDSDSEHKIGGWLYRLNIAIKQLVRKIRLEKIYRIWGDPKSD